VAILEKTAGGLMRELNPLYLQAVHDRVNACPYFSLLSMEIKMLGWGESRMEVAVQEKHLQPFGLVHGGVFSSLIDATAFWAVYPQIDEGVGMTTVEMKLNYLAPASQGVMISTGKAIRVGKTLCLGEATVKNGTGVLLAHGTVTMMVLKDLKLQGEDRLPPKFLE
jgi:uncharacterized protein (TIGR00369 family)